MFKNKQKKKQKKQNGEMLNSAIYDIYIFFSCRITCTVCAS